MQPILSVNRNNTGCTGCCVTVKYNVIVHPILSVKLNNLECTGFGVVVNVVTFIPLLIDMYIYISKISGQPTISRICIYVYR